MLTTKIDAWQRQKFPKGKRVRFRKYWDNGIMAWHFGWVERCDWINLELSLEEGGMRTIDIDEYTSGEIILEVL